MLSIQRHNTRKITSSHMLTWFNFESDLLFSSPPGPSTNVTVEVVSNFTSSFVFLAISISTFFEESLLSKNHDQSFYA